jgi:ribosomal protein S18 acetylase RimI-like enzyme
LKFYCRKSREDGRVKHPSVDAELLSIAVREGFQRKGAGASLFSGLAQELKQRKVDSFKIIVGAELKRAVSFYEKMGCVRSGQTEIHQGDVSYVYVYRIM